MKKTKTQPNKNQPKHQQENPKTKTPKEFSTTERKHSAWLFVTCLREMSPLKTRRKSRVFSLYSPDTNPADLTAEATLPLIQAGTAPLAGSSSAPSASGATTGRQTRRKSTDFPRSVRLMNSSPAKSSILPQVKVLVLSSECRKKPQTFSLTAEEMSKKYCKGEEKNKGNVRGKMGYLM